MSFRMAISWDHSAFEISTQNMTTLLFRSASIAACWANSSRILSASITRPAQSNSTHWQCAIGQTPVRTSRVVLCWSDTMLLSLPSSLFSRVLFPALGAPAIPTAGKSITVSYWILPDSNSSSWFLILTSLPTASSRVMNSISSPLKSSPASIKLRHSIRLSRSVVVVSPNRPLSNFSAAAN